MSSAAILQEVLCCLATAKFADTLRPMFAHKLDPFDRREVLDRHLEDIVSVDDSRQILSDEVLFLIVRVELISCLVTASTNSDVTTGKPVGGVEE
jgi:hypothetical protein